MPLGTEAGIIGLAGVLELVRGLMSRDAEIGGRLDEVGDTALVESGCTTRSTACRVENGGEGELCPQRAADLVLVREGDVAAALRRALCICRLPTSAAPVDVFGDASGVAWRWAALART
ncbi:MAG TPA: hypothetical protein VIF09_05835 [Polyangiaceae bacterium]